jgi:hypothetical protein
LRFLSFLNFAKQKTTDEIAPILLSACTPRSPRCSRLHDEHATENNKREKEISIMTTTILIRCRPRFELGQIVATPGAMDATTDAQRREYLARHSVGDWGCVCIEDGASNEEAVKDGLRILSAYPIDPAKPCKGFGDNTVWIITEADRSVTTFLLPNEY